MGPTVKIALRQPSNDRRPTMMGVRISRAAVGLGLMLALGLSPAMAEEGSGSASAATEGASPDRPSPKVWLEAKIDAAERLADRKVEPGTAEAEAWTAEAEALIDETVAWDELIRRSLGRHWDDVEPSEREEFSSLMRQLIQASYQSKLKMAVQENEKVRDREEPKVRWGRQELDGDEANLQATVRADRRRVDLEFSLLWQQDEWRMVDLVIDGAGTVRLYKSSFRKIIREQGWEGLMSRLRQKLDDVKAGRGSFVPGGKEG
jgi:phospholipid transport system substrate-binding protein